MADEVKRVGELQALVKTRILERIHTEFESGGTLAASTQHTKSEGTNYGMHQKSDDKIEDLAAILERVSNPGVFVQKQALNKPGQPG
ncbi:MAG: hypothetical protein QOG42_723 [Solirubrobacteraceae bacterium]|jgi:hypothetical protein|nr:hypothetical protein [Solirubrobacteraceae bacterium]